MRLPARLAFAAAIAALATPLSVARAEPPDAGAPRSTPQWVPTAALEVGTFEERLQVGVDGASDDSYRTQIRSVFSLGLSHPVLGSPDSRLWVDGHAGIGLGLVFDSGHWQLPLREDWTVAWATCRWLTLRAGLGLGLAFDLNSAARSFVELGVPVSATFFRRVELVYRPLLSLPLGSEGGPVFGGQKNLSTRLAFVPLDLALRVRVDAWGW